ncbi:MAG: hypothetical protein BWY07_01996 [Candidatus Hydrogenedentes bacterium ADurb.Bin170]|nr:MAG: hypothetical protein BWY07_01996 [Candidatus Hydrogenedentes bacterium ADurb.Bin170]
MLILPKLTCSECSNTAYAACDHFIGSKDNDACERVFCAEHGTASSASGFHFCTEHSLAGKRAAADRKAKRTAHSAKQKQESLYQ